MEKSQVSLILKIAVMILALIGVFWARSTLEQNASRRPEPLDVSIPAKVEIGK